MKFYTTPEKHFKIYFSERTTTTVKRCILPFLLLVLSAANGQLLRTASGATAADITPTRDLFRGDLGGGTVAAANGNFGGQRREINWDGVPDAFAAPNNLPANFFNVNSPRGVIFTTTGNGFQVSANASAGPVAFGNLNPSFPTLFSPFSPQRLFTPLTSNVTDVTFFVPGTTTPALTRGFGAIFSDVDVLGSTIIEFYDKENNLLMNVPVPSTAGQKTFSFAGLSYPTPLIARVRIITGNSALASGMLESLPGFDLVAMDDFLYGEPVAICTPPTFLNDKTIVLDASQCGNDGNISIVPLSGTAPFMYSIDGGVTYVSGGATIKTFQGLAAGMYQLRLKDANGCESAIVTREVKTLYPCNTCTPPTFLNDQTIVLNAICNRRDGNISIIPLSGAAPFMYSIDGGITYVPGPNSGKTFQELGAGSYTLKLKDANGCESAPVVRVILGPCDIRAPFIPGGNGPAATERRTTSQVKIYPNPSRGQFRVQLRQTGLPNVHVQVLDARGMVLQQRTVNAMENSTLDINLQGKAKGLYFVRVISNKGVQVSKVLLQ